VILAGLMSAVIVTVTHQSEEMFEGMQVRLSVYGPYPPFYCSGVSVPVIAAAGRLLWWGVGIRCFLGVNLSFSCSSRCCCCSSSSSSIVVAAAAAAAVVVAAAAVVGVEVVVVVVVVVVVIRAKRSLKGCRCDLVVVVVLVLLLVEVVIVEVVVVVVVMFEGVQGGFSSSSRCCCCSSRRSSSSSCCCRCISRSSSNSCCSSSSSSSSGSSRVNLFVSTLFFFFSLFSGRLGRRTISLHSRRENEQPFLGVALGGDAVSTGANIIYFYLLLFFLFFCFRPIGSTHSFAPLATRK